MIEHAETVRLAVQCVEFTGSNHGEIATFTGQENVTAHGHRLQVRLSEGTWQDMYPGWRVVKYEDGTIGAMTDRAYYRFCKPRVSQ